MCRCSIRRLISIGIVFFLPPLSVYGAEFTVKQSDGGTIQDAWYEAQSNGSQDDVITIADSQTYIIPPLLLSPGNGNITLRAATNEMPVIEEPADAPAFSNLSNLGESITLEGADATHRMTVHRSTLGSAPVINCGAASGNGAFALHHVTLIHNSGTRGVAFAQLNNNATNHTLDDVHFIGQVSNTMLEVGSRQVGLTTSMTPSVMATDLDVSAADGQKQVFQINHPVTLEIRNSLLTPLTSCGIITDTQHLGSAPAGGSRVIFRDCSLLTGNAIAFQKLGNPSYTNNEYYLYRPIIAGSLGETAVLINPGTTAFFYILGGNDDGSPRNQKTNISDLGASNVTQRLARLLAGRLVLQDLTSNHSSAHVDANKEGALTGDVTVEMRRCWWNNCGTVEINPTIDPFVPQPSAFGSHFMGINTVWRGGTPTDQTSWINTNGAHTAPGSVSLEHCTVDCVVSALTSPFVMARTNDTLTINGSTITGGNTSGAFSNRTSVLTVPSIFWWKDTDTNLFGPGTGFSGPASIVNPNLDSNLIPQTGSPALAAAIGSLSTDDIYGSLRPVPCGTSPDIGAIEVDYNAPTASVTLNSPSLTNGSTMVFTVAFSECVTGFDHADFNNSASSDLEFASVTGQLFFTKAEITGGPTLFTVTYTGVTGDGTLSLKVKRGLDGGDVTDLAGNKVVSGSSSAVITVDHTAPVITLNGAQRPVLNCAGTAYEELGATWTDAVDNPGGPVNLPASGISGDNVLNGPGTAGNQYTIYYQHTDQAGNAAISVDRIILVVDNDKPVITIDGGASSLDGECGQPLALPGATAVDACDGPLTVSILTLDGLIENDPSVGDYHVVYKATDSSDNANTAILTVRIRDNQPPVLHNVPGPFTRKNTDKNNDGLNIFELADAKGLVSATDSCGPDTLVVNITAHSGGAPKSFPINLAIGPYPHTYNFTYSAMDAAGIPVSASTTLTVLENELPVLTLTGDDPQLWDCPNGYIYDGYSATDTDSGPPTVSISGEVIPEVPGDYPLVYTAMDSITMKTVEKTRTVRVLDRTPPAMMLVGSSEVYVDCHGAYHDDGVTAWDACFGDYINSMVEVDNPVNVNQPGIYTISYTVNDGYNDSLPLTRTVHVVDNTPPVLTLNGSANMALPCKGSFNDPGCSASDLCAGSLQSSVTVTGKVLTGAPGQYTLTYNVSDPSGNTATPVTRQVRVTDTAPPTVYISGSNPKLILAGANCTPPAASAYDDCAGALSANITNLGGFDVTTPGIYNLVYSSAADGAGLIGQKTLVVQVAAPLEITPNVQTLINVKQGERVEMSVSVSHALSSPSFKWLLEDGRKTLVPVEKGNGQVLVFDPVHVVDQGLYICEATDPLTGSTAQSAPFVLNVTVDVQPVGITGLAGMAVLASMLGGLGSRKLHKKR